MYINFHWFSILYLNASCFLVSFSLCIPYSLISLFSFLFIAFDSIIHQPWKCTLVNRQDYNFPSLVEVLSKDQKTWWNTRCLNKRYLPSIWMEGNKIWLFLITKRFNEPCKHFTSLWSLCGFFGTSNDFGFWKVEVLEFWTICIIIVVLWL